MAVQYRISKSQPEDAKDLVDYLNYIGKETDFISFKENEFHLSVEEEEKFISESIKHSNGIMLIVRTSKNEVIGEGTCFSNERRHKHVFTMALTVKKTYWGIGIGSALCTALGLESKKLGCTKIMLHVYSHNSRAILLYKRLGYKEEGRLQDDALVNGGHVDTIIMSKFI